MELIYFDKNRNLIFSPLSIATLLNITEDATAGKTRDEIRKLTGSRVPDISSPNLTIANAVCVKKEYKNIIKRGYEEHLSKEFNGKLFTSEDLPKDVNRWTTEKTNGLITKILADNDTSDLTILNATAFKGEWKKAYFDEDVSKGNFADYDGNISDVTMLHSIESSYVENLHFTGLVKPYKDDEFSFMALLPKRRISKAMELAIKSTDLTDIFKKRKHETVVTMIPEFKASSEIDLKDYLTKKNVKTIFTNEADFGNMSTADLKADSIKHKAVIEVDREGTRAAAVTFEAVAVGCAEPPRPKAVILDRPFFYAIMHNETGMPVFAGVMNKV